MLPAPQPGYLAHKTIPKDQFAPGAAIAKNAAIRVAIPITSAGKFRFRFKCTVTGTLKAEFLSPGVLAGTYNSFQNELDGTDPVATTGNPADVTVSANTEALMEINDLAGEGYVLITFTEANVAAGVVTYANYCQL